jgi:DNA-binding HxlR family transcriptional regulator
LHEKGKKIIRALTDKPLTWKELVQETKLSEATLSRHLNRLMMEGVVHKIPAVYSLANKIEVTRPTKPMTTKLLLAKDIKRVKSRKTKIIPLVVVDKKAKP